MGMKYHFSEHFTIGYNEAEVFQTAFAGSNRASFIGRAILPRADDWRISSSYVYFPAGVMLAYLRKQPYASEGPNMP